MFATVECVESCRKLAGADAVLATDDELFDVVLSVEEARRLLDATEAHVLAQLEARGAVDAEFGLSTHTWLAREGLLPAGVARKRVQVAAKLASLLDQVDEALQDGRVSWDHARVLADACNPRVAEQVAGIQGELIALAEGATFEQWRREVMGLVDLLDEDGGHDPDGDLARNKLSIARTFDGVVHLDGTLTGEHALIAEQAIEDETDRLWRQHVRDREVCPELSLPERTTLRALALVNLLRKGAGVDLDATQGPRTDVTLVASASDPTEVVTPDGVRLDDDTVRTICCDADWHALIVDSLGVPLAMGRTIRHATAAQRRALALRDGGCIFPGCTAPAAWTDAHHLAHWHRDGGTTDLDNLVSLCRHHHRVTHRPDWTLEVDPDGWYRWRTPTGRTFRSQRHQRQRQQQPRPYGQGGSGPPGPPDS